MSWLRTHSRVKQILRAADTAQPSIGRSGDDVVDGLVHAEEVEEGAAVEAQ